MNLTRRTVLTASAGLPVLIGAAPLLAQTNGTDAVVSGPAAFTIYTRPLGDLEVVTILDGSFALGADMVTNLSEDAYEAALRDAYLDPTGGVLLGITVHLIRDGDRLTMIDSGAGSSFGPTAGRLAAAFAAAGIDPSAVDEILLTHMHPDHIGGLVNGENAAFPNASLRVSATDLSFWTDEAVASGAPESAQSFFALARGVAGAYAERIETFEGESDLGRGVTAMPLPGHTPGHCGFMIGSGDDTLLIWGDAAAVAAFQFTHPEAGITFDADGAQAAETRKALFDMAATDRLAVAGTHLPFPGFGYVERKDDAYAWVPEGWKYE